MQRPWNSTRYKATAQTMVIYYLCSSHVFLKRVCLLPKGHVAPWGSSFGGTLTLSSHRVNINDGLATSLAEFLAAWFTQHPAPQVDYICDLRRPPPNVFQCLFFYGSVTQKWFFKKEFRHFCTFGLSITSVTRTDQRDVNMKVGTTVDLGCIK